MATEPLEYRITFDTSEVAQKLQEIKSAMDVAFGATAFRAASPDPYPFQQMFMDPGLAGQVIAASLPPGTEAAIETARQAQTIFNQPGSALQTVSDFFQPPSGTINAIDAVKEGLGQSRTTFQDIRDAFNKVAETSRLGYSKFTKDIELTGLLSGALARMSTPQPLGYGEQIKQIEDIGFMSNALKGLTGQGYSPLMTMNREEYKQLNIKELKDKFMEPTWGEAGGLALSAAFAGGPVGWGLVGAEAAMLGTKALLYPLTTELRHERALESYVKGTSWRFLSGQFNKPESRETAKFLRELPDQKLLQDRDYGRLEVDEIIQTFTQAGGYDYVRTAREYRDTTKKIFDGHRELMHALHITSKEAAGLMGTLSKELGVTDFGAFAAQATNVAERAGLTRAEAAQFMVQSAEMVRGTGYNMKNFAQGASELLADVREMAKAGIVSPEDIRQFGGENNIALGMARTAMNFAGSPMGFVTQAALMSAQLGGGEDPLGQVAGMGIQEMLGRTAGTLTSPMAFARFFGKQQALADQMGPEMQMQMKTALAVQQAQMVFQRQKFTDEEFYGALKVQGYTDKEAKEMVWTRQNALIEDPQKEFDKRLLTAMEQRDYERPTIAGEFVDKASRTISKYSYDLAVKGAETAYVGIENFMTSLGRKTSDFVRDITFSVFEPRNERPEGLIAQARYGGNFAKTYEKILNTVSNYQETVEDVKRNFGMLIDESAPAAESITTAKPIISSKVVDDFSKMFDTQTKQKIKENLTGINYSNIKDIQNALSKAGLSETESKVLSKNLQKSAQDYKEQTLDFSIGTDTMDFTTAPSEFIIPAEEKRTPYYSLSFEEGYKDLEKLKLPGFETITSLLGDTKTEGLLRIEKAMSNAYKSIPDVTQMTSKQIKQETLKRLPDYLGVNERISAIAIEALKEAPDNIISEFIIAGLDPIRGTRGTVDSIFGMTGLNLDKYNAKEAIQKTSDYLYDYGKPEFKSYGAVDAVANWAIGMTYKSDQQKKFEDLAESLGLKEEELQKDLSRQAYTAFKEITDTNMFSEIKDPILKNIAMRDAIRNQMSMNMSIGSAETQSQAKDFIKNIPDDLLKIQIESGAKQARQDNKDTEGLIETIARNRLRDKKIDDPTDAQVKAMKETMRKDFTKSEALIGEFLGPEGLQGDKRIAALQKFQERFKASMAAGARTFSKHDQYGNTVFDEVSAELSRTVDLKGMNEALRGASSGDAPLYVKIKKEDWQAIN